MITIINDKELGKIEIVTQQYQLGLYVAIYKNKRLINQFGSNLISYMCYSTKDKPYFKLRHNGK
jgi:hypothetical protein